MIRAVLLLLLSFCCPAVEAFNLFKCARRATACAVAVVSFPVLAPANYAVQTIFKRHMQKQDRVFDLTQWTLSEEGLDEIKKVRGKK